MQDAGAERISEYRCIPERKTADVAIGVHRHRSSASEGVAEGGNISVIESGRAGCLDAGEPTAESRPIAGSIHVP